MSVISQEQLARMSDAELVESLRLVGSQLVESGWGQARSKLAQAASEMEAELNRRLPDGGAEVAEEVVTDAVQLPPAATVEDATVAPSEPSLLVNAGAGAVVGAIAGALLKKSKKAGAVVGGILGAIFKPIGG